MLSTTTKLLSTSPQPADALSVSSEGNVIYAPHQSSYLSTASLTKDVDLSAWGTGVYSMIREVTPFALSMTSVSGLIGFRRDRDSNADERAKIKFRQNKLSEILLLQNKFKEDKKLTVDIQQNLKRIDTFLIEGKILPIQILENALLSFASGKAFGREGLITLELTDLLSRLQNLNYVEFQFDFDRTLPLTSEYILELLAFVSESGFKIRDYKSKYGDLIDSRSFNTEYAQLSSLLYKFIEGIIKKDLYNPSISPGDIAEAIIGYGVDKLQYKYPPNSIMWKMVLDLYGAVYRDSKITVLSCVKDLIDQDPDHFIRVVMAAFADKYNLKPPIEKDANGRDMYIKGKPMYKDISYIELSNEHKEIIENWKRAPDLDALLNDPEFEQFMLCMFKQLEIYFHIPLKFTLDSLEISDQNRIKGALQEEESFPEFLERFAKSEFNDPNKYELVAVISSYDSLEDDPSNVFNNLFRNKREFDGPGALLRIKEGPYKDYVIFVYKEDKNRAGFGAGVTSVAASQTKYASIVATLINLNPDLKDVKGVLIKGVGNVALTPSKTPKDQDMVTFSKYWVRSLSHKYTQIALQGVHKDRRILSLFASKFNEFNAKYWHLKNLVTLSQPRTTFSTEDLINEMEEKNLFLQFYLEYTGKSELTSRDIYEFNSMKGALIDLIKRDQTGDYLEKLVVSDGSEDTDLVLVYDNIELPRLFRYQNGDRLCWKVDAEKITTFKEGKNKGQLLIDPSEGGVEQVTEDKLSNNDKKLLQGKAVSVLTRKEDGKNFFWVYSLSDPTIAIPNGYEFGFEFSEGKFVHDMPAFDYYATECFFKVDEDRTFVMEGGKLTLRDGLDSSSADSLERSLHKLVDVRSALIDKNSRDKKYVWIRTDLETNGKFNYDKLFETLREEKDNGFPPIIYEDAYIYPKFADAFTKLVGDGSGGISYKRVMFGEGAGFDINELIASAEADAKFTRGTVTALRLPDGNYICLDSKDNSIFVIEGLAYVQISTNRIGSTIASRSLLATAENSMAFEELTLFKDERMAASSPDANKLIESIIKSGVTLGINFDDLENLIRENGLDINILTDEIIEHLKRLEKVQKLFISGNGLSIAGLYGIEFNVIFSDEFLKILNDGKTSSQITDALIEIIDYLEEYTVMHPFYYLESLSDKDKIRILAAALDVIDGSNFYSIPLLNEKKELQKAVNSIIERIGPIAFIFLFLNKLEFHLDGSWKFLPLASTKSNLIDILERKFAISIYAGDPESRGLVHSFLLKALAADELYIDGLKIKFNNQFGLFFRPIFNYIDNLRTFSDSKAFYSLKFSSKIAFAETISTIQCLTFKLLDDFWMNSEGDLEERTLNDKKLIDLKNEIRKFSEETSSDEYIYEILTNLVNNRHKIQSRQLGTSFEWLKFTFDGKEHTLTLNERQIKEYLYDKNLLFFDPSVASTYYRSYKYGKEVHGFERFLAVLNIPTFVDRFYDTFAPIAEVHSTERTLYMKIIEPGGDPSVQKLFMASGTSEENYWVFDFSKSKENWQDDPSNFLNVRKFYASLLMGSYIRFSIKEGEFLRLKPSFVAEISISGVIVTPQERRRKCDYLFQDDRLEIEKFVNNFFTDTIAPRNFHSGGGMSAYLGIFFAEPRAFFEFLFKDLGSRDSRLTNIYTKINNLVDFETLNEKMQGNPLWKEFIALPSLRNVDPAKIRITKREQLLKFFEAVLIFKADPDTVKQVLEYFVDHGTYISPEDYDVHHGFVESLYYNKYLGD
ncbi:MAG: hypothetical protein ACFFAN_05530 [Promethearchaeota archaeon]